MKRLILSGLAGIAILSVIAWASYAWFINSSKVDLLITHYPVFDTAKGEYVLSPVKPSSWVKLNRISYEARWAIIVSEDWAFFDHEGIDLNQLKIAIKDSIQEGELTRGASTITQQVVKNVLLSNKREISRKIKEILLAREVERRLSKEKILEIYLNLIELGKNIYGVKEASFFYFNKHPRKLNAREGAFLAMLLPSPVKYSTSFYEKELTPFASEQVENILIKLRQAKIITEKERMIIRTKRFFWEPQLPVTNDDNSNEKSESIYDEYLEDAF